MSAPDRICAIGLARPEPVSSKAVPPIGSYLRAKGMVRPKRKAEAFVLLKTVPF